MHFFSTFCRMTGGQTQEPMELDQELSQTLRTVGLPEDVDSERLQDI